MKPDSQSNTKQSIDRVRDVSKAQLFALDQIEQGVESSKARHSQAIVDERNAREQLELLDRHIKECRSILGGLNDEYTAWQVCV
jgi:hypothetical protein